MEHTAGPWKIKWKDNVVSESERLICNCAGHQCNIYSYEIDEENEANARLIAAAPELLEACKDLMSHEYNIGAVCQNGIIKNCLCRDCVKKRAMAAIAKAEGK